MNFYIAESNVEQKNQTSAQFLSSLENIVLWL